MATVPLPIVGDYNVQRFRQHSPEDAANWSMVKAPNSKGEIVLYPTLGRSHITYAEINRLVFAAEPRAIFRTDNYWYAIVGSDIIQIDSFYNQTVINNGTNNQMTTFTGDVWFCYMNVIYVTFAVFTDGEHMYVWQEQYVDRSNPLVPVPRPGIFYIVTDKNAPQQPTYIATFGNRVVCANLESTQCSLTQIALGGPITPAAATPPAIANTLFTIAGSAVFFQASGIVKQFGVINNTLYVFTPFTIDPWSNIPSQIPIYGKGTTTFPWKQSSTYSFNFGIADSSTLDVDFNMMVWLAQNQNGLVQVMMSDGGRPKRISSKAIDVLFQKYVNSGSSNPFALEASHGFLYQYENTIYYRISAGPYSGIQVLDQEFNNNCIEFNFDTQTWSRVIEANGQRSRTKKHVFFNNVHLVTVDNDKTVYNMSGQYYYNEISNPDASDPQAADAYIKEPFRYERVTPIISQQDYSEFRTEYVQIDFVWGDSTFINSNTPFDNAVFITTEDGKFIVSEDNSETFLITEGSNTPSLDSFNYNKMFKPHIELYFSDDGGINFLPADVREFSQLGVYSWRMRWYQLGCSRNRVYKLICVSPAPIVILGGIMEMEVVSDGAH